MNYKKLNFFLASVLVILLFFTIPINNNWLYSKVIGGENNLLYQVKHLDVADRKLMRYGYSYQVYLNMLADIPDKKSALILLPPAKYLKAMGVQDFVTVEPAVFYYYTGLNSVWANSPDAGRANWAVGVNSSHRVRLRQIMNPAQLDTLLPIFRKLLQ